VIRRLVLIIVAVLGGVFMLLLMSPMFAAVFSAMRALLTGWLSFPIRTLPAVSWNWAAVGFTVLASAAILILLHRLGGWFWRSLNSSAGRWRWRWSAAAFAAVWLVFGYVLASVGVAHQVGWMLSSDEPLMRDTSLPYRMHFFMHADQIWRLAAEGDWDMAEFQARVPIHFGKYRWLEELQLIPLADASGKIRRLLVVPREPRQQETIGFAILRPIQSGGESTERTDIREISALPAAFDLSNP